MLATDLDAPLSRLRVLQLDEEDSTVSKPSTSRLDEESVLWIPSSVSPAQQSSKQGPSLPLSFSIFIIVG